MIRDPAEPLTVGPWLRRLSREHGDRVAVARGHDRLTYSAFDTRSSALGAALVESGVSKGARVGILLPNGPAWIVAFAAVARIGAVAVPISTLATARELGWLLGHAAVERVIAIESDRRHDYLDRLESAVPGLATADGTSPLALVGASRLRAIHVVGTSRSWVAPLTVDALGPTSPTTANLDCDHDMLKAIEATVHPGDPLRVIHTSGSTADPKGVIHGHGTFLSHTRNMAHDYAAPRGGEVFCSPRPWFWVAGLAADLSYTLHVGATFVVPDSLDPAPMARLVRDEHIDFLGGAFPWFIRLASSSEFADFGLTCLPNGIDVAGIASTVSSTLAPDPVTADTEPTDESTPRSFVSRRFERLVPAATAATFDAHRFPNLLGMTEMIGTHSGLPHGTVLPAGREGSSGPPMPGIERWVVSIESGTPVDHGSSGELLVRGDSMMHGLDRRTRSETFDADGWYRTGDLCRLDDDGWITYRGRLDDTVKISGANVAPLEVERALYGHPDVIEAHVAGVPGDDGITLTAAIVSHSGAIDAAALITWMRERLSSYKVPRSVVEVHADDIPRTASGKVRRSELIDVLSRPD